MTDKAPFTARSPIEQLAHYFAARFDRLEKMMASLQENFDAVVVTFTDYHDDVTAKLEELLSMGASMRDTMALQAATIDRLSADDASDKATISSLQAQNADLQSQLVAQSAVLAEVQATSESVSVGLTMLRDQISEADKPVDRPASPQPPA